MQAHDKLWHKLTRGVPLLRSLRLPSHLLDLLALQIALGQPAQALSSTPEAHKAPCSETSPPEPEPLPPPRPAPLRTKPKAMAAAPALSLPLLVWRKA